MNACKVKIMGILNVTPDSFSDGGRFFGVEAAVSHGLKMADEGADIIDIGGESSGPDSGFVPEEEELRRVIPVIKKLARLLREKFGRKYVEVKFAGREPTERKFAAGRFAASKSVPLISVDTYKARVARQAVEAGAEIVNDVTALRGDPDMAKTVAENGAKIILMYSKDKTARTTRAKKRYKDVVKTVQEFLAERIAFAQKAGIKKSNIIIDPGMGAFLSGIPKYSYEVLRQLKEFEVFDCSILVGVSRKSFLPGGSNERLEPTLAANILAILNGAAIIRVHDVASHKRMLETLSRYFAANPPS